MELSWYQPLTLPSQVKSETIEKLACAMWWELLSWFYVSSQRMRQKQVRFFISYFFIIALLITIASTVGPLFSVTHNWTTHWYLFTSNWLQAISGLGTQREYTINASSQYQLSASPVSFVTFLTLSLPNVAKGKFPPDFKTTFTFKSADLNLKALEWYLRGFKVFFFLYR